MFVCICLVQCVCVFFVFFNCLVIFYNIINGIIGLIRPLQEPETLLMSLVFFLYLQHDALKRPDRA